MFQVTFRHHAWTMSTPVFVYPLSTQHGARLATTINKTYGLNLNRRFFPLLYLTLSIPSLRISRTLLSTVHQTSTMSSSVNQAAANQTTPHTSNPRIPPSRMLRRFPAMFIPIYLPTSSPQSAPSTAAQPLHSAMNTGATHSVGAGAVKKPTFVIPENRQLRRSKAIRHWDLDPSLTKALAIGELASR